MTPLEVLVNMSVAWFADKEVNDDTIKKFIQEFVPNHSAEDKTKLYEMIECKHTVVVQGDYSVLDDNNDHEDWFNTSLGVALNRDIKWHFWDHLKEYFQCHKFRPSQIIKKLDQFTNEILSRLEDPHRSGAWYRRGVVMGSVQSGKTSNYTALICKAIDAGYKFIIVLAGVHNSLRSQTQDRLNEEVIGYDLDKIQKITVSEGHKKIGVRRAFPDHQIVNTLTSSSPTGDFSRTIALQAGITPSVSGDPIILIIKKNTSILRNLVNWLQTLPITKERNNRTFIEDVPMLLIDDECDFASVNTRQQEYDEDGNVIAEWDPTKTNKLIRTIMNTFEKRCYVGYTATPYANIFINKDNDHPVIGEDLFPRHFIISLPVPSNYMGPEKFFGLDAFDENEQPREPLPLLRIIDDQAGHIPDTHKKTYTVTSLPQSLKTAIKSFILTCAARRIRGGDGEVPHNSMLIHVTRFTAVQSQLRELVEDEMQRNVALSMSEVETENNFKELWETDFVNTTREMIKLGFKDARIISWNEVKHQIYQAAKKILIKTINGEVSDILDYRNAELSYIGKISRGEKIPWCDRGISVIAIGGDKLSRGLTLEGLSISYYLRASKMYDTLMQMGRWFGYHDGYSDLCRIYTTRELCEWYRFIASATKELREDLEYMAAIKATPENFGLKVRNHPGRLAITAAGKFRNAERLLISFSGQFPKTIVFDPRYSQSNFIALEKLIERLDKKPNNKVQNVKNLHWKDIEPEHVINFLINYTTQEAAKKVVDPGKIAEYIQKQYERGELTNWDVVVINIESSLRKCKVGKYTIGCAQRTPDGQPTEDNISIGTLTDPKDEMLDFSESEKNQEFINDINDGKIPGSRVIRSKRPITRGLLLIYILSNMDYEITSKRYGDYGEEVTGFAVSFPESPTAQPIEYYVNSVYNEE